MSVIIPTSLFVSNSSVAPVLCSGRNDRNFGKIPVDTREESQCNEDDIGLCLGPELTLRAVEKSRREPSSEKQRMKMTGKKS